MDARISNTERLYGVDWDGPFSIEELTGDLDDSYESGPSAWCIYALTSHHPLYGDDVIVYIGKAVKQSVIDRLKQHKWWEGEAYLAAIYDFQSWGAYNEAGYSKAIRDEKIVSAIEELLIYSLAPAYNSRNKKSAVNSTSFRIFNTGETGSIPSEISGFYYIEQGPEPEDIDVKAGD